MTLCLQDCTGFTLYVELTGGGGECTRDSISGTFPAHKYSEQRVRVARFQNDKLKKSGSIKKSVADGVRHFNLSIYVLS